MSKSVLILGGGFAGRMAAETIFRRRGRGLAVKLVDVRPASEFSPMYPDLVSGRLHSDALRHSLDVFARRLGIEFVRARITQIDLPGRRVVTDAGDLSADFIIMCMGCRTDFHGSKEMEERTLGIKSIFEAKRICASAQRHIESMCGRNERFHLVVIGGGYTGIEVASHLGFLLRCQRRSSWRRLRELAAVVVLEKAGRVLEMIPKSVADWAVRHIRSQDIQVRTGTTVERFLDGGAIRLTDGSTLDNAMVVWAAGVTPVHPCDSLKVPRAAQDRLAVDEYMHVSGHEQVFAAGDLAAATPPGHEEPMRMAVQSSRIGGMTAAHNVLAAIGVGKLQVFDPFDPGYVVPLAQSLGVGVILGREYHGRLPYELHYVMCLVRAWSWQCRLAMARDLLHLPPRRGR